MEEGQDDDIAWDTMDFDLLASEFLTEEWASASYDGIPGPSNQPGVPVQVAESTNATSQPGDSSYSLDGPDEFNPPVDPSGLVYPSIDSLELMEDDISGFVNFDSPELEVATAMPVAGEQSQPTSDNSLSHRRLVPLLPKTLALAPHVISSNAKGKRKRSLSPQVQSSVVPKDFLCVFRATEEFGAAKEEQQQPPVRKRTRSAKACLRCQLQKLAVSRRYSLRLLGRADMSIVLGQLSL